MKTIQWTRGNGRQISHPLEDEIRQVLQKEQAAGLAHKMCIGTDSQVKGSLTDIATVIVFIRKGKGGFMYVRKEQMHRKMTVKERMLQEVQRSIEVACSLYDLCIAFNVDMEIHADINTNPAFKSNSAMKEAMGYIMGMGFDFRAKPQAFASSNCANKMVQ